MLVSKSPTFVRAEFGTYTSLLPEDEKGKVEINITERNGGTYLNLNFDFSTTYLVGLIIIIFAMVIVYSAFAMFFDVKDARFPLALTLALGLTVAALIPYSVSTAKKKFTREFNMFIESIKSKK